MNSKLFGGILLIIGTTIGAGILALPVATAQLGFTGSLILLVICWAVMLACALLFLEANLWLPPNSNLISMAGVTLGRHGQVLSWVINLFLLYSIISAYIAGGGDVFHYLLNANGIPVTLAQSSIIFTLLFGSIVYLGMRSVDYVNRGLMFGKLGAFIVLVLLILPFVSGTNLSHGDLGTITSQTSITVTAVAFGCLMIIPSLRTYFNSDIKSLRIAIVVGMTIPLLCYIAWDLVIMGVIPYEGEPGLSQIARSTSTNSDLLVALSTLLQKETITLIAKFFTSICMVTSFLSISLSLSDFIADGVKVKKEGVNSLLVFVATFMPPLLVVLFYPDAFIRSLNYAGLSCFILMILLPPLMVWRGRYTYALGATAYQVKGGRFLLATIMIFAVVMIGYGIEGAL